MSAKEFAATLKEILAVCLPNALELYCKIGVDSVDLVWPDAPTLRKEMLLFPKTCVLFLAVQSAIPGGS